MKTRSIIPFSFIRFSSTLSSNDCSPDCDPVSDDIDDLVDGVGVGVGIEIGFNFDDDLFFSKSIITSVGFSICLAIFFNLALKKTK